MHRYLAPALMLAFAGAVAACAPRSGGGDIAPPTDGQADQCRTSKYQAYIGRNRSELPPKPEGETWRVVCSTCAMTMDYHAGRLNIVYDVDTNIIQRLSCG